MVIDMNEAQVRTLQPVRQVLADTQVMEFQAAAGNEDRYAWIDTVLKRFDYPRLARTDRGPVLAYLQRLSGYSRSQITRLVSRWDAGKPLVKNYGAPRHPFARLYTPADVALLVDVDRAMGTLSGPATACVLRRQRDVFGDERFQRLGSISVGHLYNLRHSPGYRNQRVVLTKTQPTKNTQIGVRKAPAPEGRPGFIRIDSVHQGDLDGIKGLYHINAVDCVTQWQVVASVQTISEAHLLSVIEEMLAQFPFGIQSRRTAHCHPASARRRSPFAQTSPSLVFQRPHVFGADGARRTDQRQARACVEPERRSRRSVLRTGKWRKSPANQVGDRLVHAAPAVRGDGGDRMVQVVGKIDGGSHQNVKAS